MAKVSADLELRTGEAFAEVDRLEAALQSAVSGVGESLGAQIQSAVTGDYQVVIEPEVDTTEAEAALEAAVADAGTATIEVDADIATLEEVAEAVAAIDGDTAEVAVTADTSEAVDQLDQVTESSLGAQEAVSAVGAELGGLAAVTTGALSGPTAAIGAFVGANALLFTSAVEAESSLQAFNARVGEAASEIENVDVGGLNEDLGDLAIRLGSSDEGARNAAASIFALGEASGKSAQEVAATVEQIIALSARAVALNPELGDIGTTAERLVGALARGRGLQDFAISLTAADINARALEDSTAKTTAELSLYERAAAGAAIATEQFGDSLADDVAAGAENAAIKVRSLRERFGELLEEGGRERTGGITSALGALVGALEQYQEGVGEFNDSFRGTGDLAGTDVFVRAIVEARAELLGLTDAQAANALVVATNVDGVIDLDRALSELEIRYGVAGDEAQQAAEQQEQAAIQTERAQEKAVRAAALAAEQIDEAGAAAASALQDIGQSTIDAVGVISTAFDDLNEDGTVSLYEFTAALEQQVADQAAFLDAIGELQRRGASDLALALFEQGLSASSAAQEAAALNDQQLAEREAFIDETTRQNDLLVIDAATTRAELVAEADGTRKDVEKALQTTDLAGALEDPFLAAELEAERGGERISEAIVEGYRSGALSKKDALKAIAEEQAQEVVTTWREVLGIFSPSKVFEDLGAQTIAGFVAGVEGADAAARDAVDRAIPAIDATATIGGATNVTLGEGAVQITVTGGDTGQVVAELEDRVPRTVAEALLRTEVAAS